MRPSGRQKLQLNNNKFIHQEYQQQLIDNNCDEQNKQMREIKSRQLLSTIMDTIEQKSNNNEQLKQSMRHFDKQQFMFYIGRLMRMYGSSQNNRNTNSQNKNSNSQNNKNNNNFVSNTKQIGNFINPHKANTLYKTIDNTLYKKIDMTLYKTIENDVDNVGSFSNNNRQMRHTVSYRQNRQSSATRQQLQDNNNINKQPNISAIVNNDHSKTLKQSMNNNIQLPCSNNNIQMPYNNNNDYLPYNNNKSNNNKSKNNIFMSNKQLTVSTSVYKLQVPKPNSLTDKFMQLVLGSQQQLIQQYDRTVNPQKYQQQKKQLVIENVKKQWFKNQSIPATNSLYQYNNYINPNGSNNPTYQLKNSNNNDNYINNNNYDNYINSSYMNSNNISPNQSKAFYDEDYYTYLKTNIKYLTQINTQQSKLNNNNNTKLGSTLNFKSQIQSKQLMNHFNKTITRPQNYNFSHLQQQQQQQQKQQKQQQQKSIYNGLIQGQQDTIQFVQDNNRVLLACDPKKIINKLKQTGGIQNTIKKMQKSLIKHQLQHLKNKQYLTIPNNNNISKQSQKNNKNKLIIEFNQSSSNKLQSKNQSQLLKKNKPPLSSFVQRQRNKQNNIITTTKSLNNNFIHKNQDQNLQRNQHRNEDRNQHRNEDKINYNQNQFIDKTNNKELTRNNKIIEIQPRNKSTWRQKSQSMRNKIHQSLSKHIN